MDIAARLEATKAQLEQAEERIAMLEDMLGMSAQAPFGLGLTPTQARLLGALRARKIVTKPMAMACLYDNLGKDPAEIKIVDVLICKIRQKLKPWGVTITTHWGEGYSLSPDAKARLDQLAGAP